MQIGIFYHDFLQQFESLFSTGVVTSPNYPGYYPNNIDKTERIEVESGAILRIEFTHFNVHFVNPTCETDYVKITDGDGRTLMKKSCGPNSNGHFVIGGGWRDFIPPIRTRSNIVEIIFHTDGAGTRNGWNLSWISWSAPPNPGECKHGLLNGFYNYW